MNKDELITKVEMISFYPIEIEKNLHLMLQHARYIETTRDVCDDMARGLLDVVPGYLRKQIERMKYLIDCKDNDPDIVSWISRNLMELFFTLRYMYSSRERYEEVIKEQLIDLKEIEEVLCPNNIPTQNSSEQIRIFHYDMNALWKALESYGVRRDDLKRPQQVRHFAEGAQLLGQYNRSYRIHSKYVHPTSYFLFGHKSFVFGEDVIHFFWIMAQYYAAWNLRDLHCMIEAAMMNQSGT